MPYSTNRTEATHLLRGLLETKAPFFVPSRSLRACLLACLLLLGAAGLLAARQAASPAPTAETVARGISLVRLADPTLLSPPGPLSVQALRLDPRHVALRMARPAAKGPSRATVPEIAAHHRALAGVNAGFFVVESGQPAGLLKVDGTLVSATRLPRGAVAVEDPSWRHPLRLLFDRVTVQRPSERRTSATFAPQLGTPARAWARARHAVGGAGLLLHAGRELSAEDWALEKLAPGFTDRRHPRTLIGVDRLGRIWLIVVDGRNPSISLGMTFAELLALARRLHLRDALNLDGGGSTTMVVRGEVVNHPSDPTGPRPVSDALLVFAR